MHMSSGLVFGYAFRMETSRRATHPLPPGQRAAAGFPPFGITRLAARIPRGVTVATLEVQGDVAHALTLRDPLATLARVTQVSDFHCVTTWTARDQRWGGVRFADFHTRVIVPRCAPAAHATMVLLRGADGARSAMLLEDLLADDVLLADELNGAPLPLAHGAPLRLIAPRHYGYKSVKYLSRLTYCAPTADYPISTLRFMDHPRARVAEEERGRWFAGALLRHVYRPFIGPTVRAFERALRR
jgi:DMSO/TMAO reductase YedYZ molybdopterin-dependent catalytic subunit